MVEISSVMQNFLVYGDFLRAQPYGNGHINDTFLVELSQAGNITRYILQRINSRIFADPAGLMDNISRITTEMNRQLVARRVPDASRRALTTLRTTEGLPYYKDAEGNYWRLYFFIEGAFGYDVIEHEHQAYQAAKAFGQFQGLLTALPGPRLKETIPGFHDTPGRFRTFQQTLDEDVLGRKKLAGPEVDFFLSFESHIGRLTESLRQGTIPERVTHNDTKLNNVLLDPQTHEAVCVIDLDTTMPGLVAYDFGDMVRTSTTTAKEDEPDLDKVQFLPSMFDALARGYIEGSRNFLTEAEAESLAFGGFLMTYEVGIRFLTDFLKGDIYFKIKYEEHNLVRCRTQMRLAQILWDSMGEREEQVLRHYQGRLAQE